MPALNQEVLHCLQNNFKSLDKEKGISSIQNIREKAFGRFSELGFPTPKNEEWKYTNVNSLSKTPFPFPKDIFAVPDFEEVKKYTLENLPGPKLVFVNGHFVEELSLLKAHLPKGVKIYPLHSIFSEKEYQKLDPFDRQCLEKNLGQHALYQDQPFVTLNTSFLKHGVFIRLRKGVTLEKPIQIVFFSTKEEEPFATHPRLLIVLGENSQASIIESYVGLSDHVHLTSLAKISN